MTGNIETDTEFETTFDEVLAGVPDEAFDRSRFVPGVGPLDAALVFVGSAGGRLDSLLSETSQPAHYSILTTVSRKYTEKEQNRNILIPTYHPASTFYDDSTENAIEEDVRTAAQTADLLE